MSELRGSQLAVKASRPPHRSSNPSYVGRSLAVRCVTVTRPQPAKTRPTPSARPTRKVGLVAAQEQADLVTNSEGPSSMKLLSASYTVAKHPITDAADA